MNQITAANEMFLKLKKSRPGRRTLDVKEWGGPVKLLRISAREQLGVVSSLDIQAETEDLDDSARGIDPMVELISLSVVDDKGCRVFDSPGGRTFLRNESLSVISRVGNEAMALHDFGGVADQDLDEQKKTD